MLNKDFYIIFGKLLYALAKSDGFIQEIEKNKIMELVKDKMVLIEQQNDFSGTDLAYYTEFAFEAAPPAGLQVTAGDKFTAPGILFALSMIHLGSFIPTDNTLFVV